MGVRTVTTQRPSGTCYRPPPGRGLFSLGSFPGSPWRSPPPTARAPRTLREGRARRPGRAATSRRPSRGERGTRSWDFAGSGPAPAGGGARSRPGRRGLVTPRLSGPGPSRKRRSPAAERARSAACGGPCGLRRVDSDTGRHRRGLRRFAGVSCRSAHGGRHGEGRGDRDARHRGGHVPSGSDGTSLGVRLGRAARRASTFRHAFALRSRPLAHIYRLMSEAAGTSRSVGRSRCCSTPQTAWTCWYWAPRGYGPIRRVLLGSVSSGLVRAAPCPVLVAPRPAPALADQQVSAKDAISV